MSETYRQANAPVPGGAVTKWGKLKREWAAEGPVGMMVWAADWTLWKTGLYYAMSGTTAEKVQARLRYARRVKKYGIREPIIVYQMGKVGSSSMDRSLRALRLNVPVYHLHFLNHADEFSAWAIQTLRVYERELEMAALAKKLKGEIERGTAPRYNLVSMVRAPTPRNISTYFHNIDSHFPDFQKRMEAGTLSSRDIADYFVNVFKETTPQRWFDEEVRDVFGLDVYAEPFARQRGYQLFENENARLLVIRLEDLNRVVAPSLNEFLNIPEFKLIPMNIGENKKYGMYYKDFLATLKLPHTYIEETNGTRYAQHFYTPQELNASVAPWLLHAGGSGHE